MSDDGLDELDYYTLLGVPDDADADAVKRAFRSFARKYHPDRFAEADDAKKKRADRIYRRGSEAFQVLTDPESRKLYDTALARGVVRLTDDVREKLAPEAPRAAPRKAADQIQSVEARTYFKKAVDLARTEDWVGAWKALRAANLAEPRNPFLEERFRQVDELLRQKGGKR